MFTSDPIENQYFSALDDQDDLPTSAHMTPDTISCQQSGLSTGTDMGLRKAAPASKLVCENCSQVLSFNIEHAHIC